MPKPIDRSILADQIRDRAHRTLRKGISDFTDMDMINMFVGDYKDSLKIADAVGGNVSVKRIANLVSNMDTAAREELPADVFKLIKAEMF